MMDRRDFFKLSAALGAIAIPVGNSAWAAVQPSLDGAAGSVTQRKLVVIFLRGAVDGLNVVVPYSESNYYRMRSTIAIGRPNSDGGALDLDGRFGLHPALAPLMPYWNGGQLAFVHAAGSPDPTRSHFDAQDYMESGTPGRKSTPDGWMNRLLGALPADASGASTPTRAVSVGPVLPRIYAGPVSVANIASGAAGTRATVLDRPAVGDAFAQLYQGDDKMARAYKDAQSAHREVMASMEESGNSEKEMQAASNGAPLPNGFPDDASRLAGLMRRDPKVQMAFMALGGWDTHANQGGAKGQLANRLAPLGQGLAALAQGLGPTFDDTTIVVISEFGRTAHQNGNGGTDHGHGNVMWVLGGRVNGKKVHGDWPGLDDRELNEQRDLAITTDFRTVLAQVAERHLLLPDSRLAAVFPQMPTGGASVKLYRA